MLRPPISSGFETRSVAAGCSAEGQRPTDRSRRPVCPPVMRVGVAGQPIARPHGGVVGDGDMSRSMADKSGSRDPYATQLCRSISRPGTNPTPETSRRRASGPRRDGV